MKRLSYIIILIAAVSALISCEHVLCVDGAWDPMELDKTHVNFPSEGGQNTVSVLNYTRWWISGGYDTLDGGWYHVMVPDKGKSNTIIITVDPINVGGQSREAIIEMQAGNAFSKISIAQN